MQNSKFIEKIESECKKKGINLTGQRKIIAEVIDSSSDHPDVEEIYNRVSKKNSNIGLATVYRTLKLFEELDVIEKYDFRDGRSRYEKISEEEHHDHLIDVKTGKVIEFYDKDLEELKTKIADKLGYNLVDHRLELYAVPKK